MTSISVAEAKARLSDLVSRAEDGEELVITRHGKPVARLVPVKKTPTAFPSLKAFRASMPKATTPSVVLLRGMRDDEY
jgi:prevent-host-death family protein